MILHHNRGMFLEEIINISINKYRESDTCYIYKRNLDLIYVHNDTTPKVLAKNKSTCDYYGIYKGAYIEFEAKEISKNKFPINSLAKHQLKQLELVDNHKGISFVIIYFWMYDEFYLLPYKIIKKWLSTQKSKSICFSFIKEHGYKLELDHTHFLDFISVVNHLINYI